MKTKKYSPILAPNEQIDLDDIDYPILASMKLDGIRCIFYKGEMLSRSLKPIQNKQLREKFAPIVEYTRVKDLILDGEIYSHVFTFQEITRYVMTKDFTDKKSIKKFGKVLVIPEHLKFYCFDSLNCGFTNNFEIKTDEEFEARLEKVKEVSGIFNRIMVAVEHREVKSKKEIEVLFKKALNEEYEGLILRNPKGKYKFGRCTLKEGNVYKVKPYITFDGKIQEVIQSTIVDPNAEKKTNELGRSVTSKKKGDRILIEKASAFLVNYEDKQLKVVLAMTDDEKEEVWKNKETYIGKTIEYKGMVVGSKDVPRHPVMLRLIDPKTKD